MSACTSEKRRQKGHEVLRAGSGILASEDSLYLKDKKID